MFKTIRSYLKNQKSKSAIVYYGQEVDYSKLKNIDYIILQPAHIDTDNTQFTSLQDNIYAYVSIGEISPSVIEYKDIKKEWIVSRNEAWNSDILDIRNREYQDFLFEKILDPIIASGFRNLFFDTLDSYHLAIAHDYEKYEYEVALSMLIKRIHDKYPEIKLMLNRGFEIIESVAPYVDAVLFESYYFGLGSGTTSYVSVSQADREWLNIHLDKIKSLGIDIIALDYLDENNMDRADKAIKVIRKNGMIPYISNRNLDIYGKTLL